MALAMARIQSEQPLAADRPVNCDQKSIRTSLGRTNPKRYIEHLDVKNTKLQSEVKKLGKELKEAADSASRNAALINELINIEQPARDRLLPTFHV